MDIDFGKLTVLVIDDHPGMRTSMRMTLSNFGVTKTDMAQGAWDAVGRIKQRGYNVIVCDYNLGDGRNGQQLLEELRHSKLISMATVFLMVTAERSYEKVISAAELAPDDYLIKPFTAEALQQRLVNILKKKTAFARVYRWMEDGHVEQAIDGCDQVAAAVPAYTVDAWRLKAELLIAVGRVDESQELYNRVLALRAVPWARMGLARTLFLQEHFEEAEGVLLDLVEDSPDYMAAQDMLAKVLEAENKAAEALAVLARAAEKSPNTLTRQRTLGEMAINQGELPLAEHAYNNVVSRSLYSILRNPDDHARLARVQVDQGKLQEASSTLKELRSHYPNNPQAEFSAAVVESLKEKRAGNPDAARRALDNALKLREQHGLAPSENLTLDLARACMTAGQEEEGRRLVETLIHNNHEDTALLDRSRRLFSDLGKAEEGEKLVQSGVKAAVSLNNEAVLRARQGDLVGAAAMLQEAAGKLPNNVQILLNAAHAILTVLSREGWDPARADVAKGYLEQARKRNPEHPKLIKVTGLYRELARKFGVLK